MRRCLKHIFFIFLAILINIRFCYALDIRQQVEQAIENFCTMEFQGNLMDEERGALVKYTPQSEEYRKFEVLSKNSDGIAPHLYPYEWNMEKDPIFIVNAYKILEIKQIDSKHAFVLVKYNQLARFEESSNDTPSSKSGKLIKDVRDISVKLNLEYDGKRWWIIDPPFPKIDIKKVIASYEEKMERRKKYQPEISVGKATPHQKDSYNEDMRNLTLLKKLSDG